MSVENLALYVYAAVQMMCFVKSFFPLLHSPSPLFTGQLKFQEWWSVHWQVTGKPHTRQLNKDYGMSALSDKQSKRSTYLEAVILKCWTLLCVSLPTTPTLLHMKCFKRSSWCGLFVTKVNYIGYKSKSRPCVFFREYNLFFQPFLAGWKTNIS